MSSRWVPVCALIAVGLVRPATAGTTEDWIRWRLEHEEQLLLEEFGEEEALDPLALSAAAGWPWDFRAAPEDRARVLRIGVAPAPPTVSLRAGLTGGPRPEAAVGLVVSMGSRPVYRAARSGSAPAPVPDGIGAAGAGAARAGGRHEALARLLRGEPDVRDVQEAAIRHAGCTEEAIRTLERDARAFGALPEISVKGGLDGGWDRDLDPFGNTTGMDDEQSWDVQLELEWDLADLAMSYERIRVQAERQDMVEHRAKLLEAVTATYFERQHLRAELRAGDALTEQEQLALELALHEVTALLDAMTGGAFSGMVEVTLESENLD